MYDVLRRTEEEEEERYICICIHLGPLRGAHPLEALSAGEPRRGLNAIKLAYISSKA